MKSKSNIGKIIISLPICIGLALFISANILNTTVKNHYIKIYGLYGNNIAIADIEELSLKDTIPTINKRVNGIMLTNGKKKDILTLMVKMQDYTYIMMKVLLYILKHQRINIILI